MLMPWSLPLNFGIFGAGGLAIVVTDCWTLDEFVVDCGDDLVERCREVCKGVFGGIQ